MKLSIREIKRATYHGRKGTAHYLWDDAITGFGVRLYASGRKSFVISYRANGRQRFHTLGYFGELTLDEARTVALEKLAAIRRGTDPSAERLERHQAATVADLAERYMREHAQVKKKASSTGDDERSWRLHVLPRIGRRKVADVTRADIASLHAAMSKKPYAANRTLALLSKAFNLAEVWGWRPDGTNPTRHVERYREEPRERYLSEEELTRLSETLRDVEREQTESPAVVAAIRLLMLTGCRVSEVLRLTWAEVDFQSRCLRLADSKTGRRTVPLNTAAVQVLVDLDRDNEEPFVIRGAKPGCHLSTLTRPWHRIRERAGLGPTRLHDLRHTFASVSAAAGLSLPMIGKLLGHRTIVTTQRYAHLHDDPTRRATEMVGAWIGAMMEGGRGVAAASSLAPLSRACPTPSAVGSQLQAVPDLLSPRPHR